MDLNKYTDIIKNIPFHVVQNINSWTFRNSLYALDTTTFSTRTSWIEQPYDSAIPCLSIYSWTCLKESMSEYLQRPCSSMFIGGYPQYSQYGISLRDSGHTNGQSKKKRYACTMELCSIKNKDRIRHFAKKLWDWKSSC